MKCQVLFSGEQKKNISKCLLKFSLSILNIKTGLTLYNVGMYMYAIFFFLFFFFFLHMNFSLFLQSLLPMTSKIFSITLIFLLLFFKFE